MSDSDCLSRTVCVSPFLGLSPNDSGCHFLMLFQCQLSEHLQLFLNFGFWYYYYYYYYYLCLNHQQQQKKKKRRGYGNDRCCGCWRWCADDDSKPKENQDVHMPAINLAEKQRTEKIREKMRVMQEKRKVKERLRSVVTREGVFFCVCVSLQNVYIRLCVCK